MLNEHINERKNDAETGGAIIGAATRPDQIIDHNIPPAPRCFFHGRYNLSCATPLMREIEAVSRYALDTLGVRPGYIENLKRFKETIRPDSLCYSAYMRMLDRLAAYAERLQVRQSGGVED